MIKQEKQAGRKTILSLIYVLGIVLSTFTSQIFKQSILNCLGYYTIVKDTIILALEMKTRLRELVTGVWHLNVGSGTPAPLFLITVLITILD